MMRGGLGGIHQQRKQQVFVLFNKAEFAKLGQQLETQKIENV